VSNIWCLLFDDRNESHIRGNKHLRSIRVDKYPRHIQLIDFGVLSVEINIHIQIVSVLIED